MPRPLAEPQEVWHFDLLAPPDASATKNIDLEFTAKGQFNAVVYWFKLHLIDDIYFETGPTAVAKGIASHDSTSVPSLQVSGA